MFVRGQTASTFHSHKSVRLSISQEINVSLKEKLEIAVYRYEPVFEDHVLFHEVLIVGHKKYDEIYLSSHRQ